MINDTIDKQVAIDALNLADDKGQIRSIMDVVQILKNLPPVDAVPVVRCRNCRFSQRINDWVYYCYVFNVDKILNQYCDMGERKEDEHEAD